MPPRQSTAERLAAARQAFTAQLGDLKDLSAEYLADNPSAAVIQISELREAATELKRARTRHLTVLDARRNRLLSAALTIENQIESVKPEAPPDPKPAE